MTLVWVQILARGAREAVGGEAAAEVALQGQRSHAVGHCAGGRRAQVLL